jgi:uncharacterized protein
MGKAVEIYKGQDFYVPSFQVVLVNRPLNKEVVRDIIQVSYKDDIKQIDSFEITINNWDAEKRSFKYSDQHLFDPGKQLELWMGYFGKDPLRLMIKGEITSLRPTFPASGQPTLAISGQNALHRFRGEQKSRAYINKTDGDIAREIGHSLDVDVETNEIAEREKYQYVIQDTQYDLVFLMERAQRIGCEIVIAEKGTNVRSEKSLLRFVPSDHVRQTTYHLIYGRSLIEFQPELTTANQVNEVVVRGWDSKNKEKFEGVAKRNQSRTRSLDRRQGEEGIQKSFQQRKEIIANRPVNSKQEAETMAKEALENMVKETVKGRGSTVGLPDLCAGSVLMIDGLGERFKGRYYVTSTTHTIGGGGYTTQFECRMEEV